MAETGRDAPDGTSVATWARRHRWFLGVFGIGVALRIVTMLGYRPALWFPDSYTYVVTALRPRPDLVRPAGYSMFLRLLEPFHSFAVVTLVQHVLGLLVGVLIYLTVLGRRRPMWAAVLASAPVLLDAYQIELEHLLVSDTLFMFFVVVATCVALRRLTWRTALATGLFLAAATMTRTIGLPLIAAFAFFISWYGLRAARAAPPGLEPRAGRFRHGRRAARAVPPGMGPWAGRAGAVRLTGVFLLAALVPTLAYGGWFYAVHHRVGLVGANGVFLYARTMSFADCAAMRPPPDLAVLCDPRRPEERPPSQEYIWNATSPLVRLPGITFTRETDGLAGRFAALAISSQPLDYAGSALTELGRAFAWGRPVYPDAEVYGYYEFPRTPPAPPGRHPARLGVDLARQYERGPIWTEVVEPYAGWMRAYQSVVFLPGVLLLVILLLPPLAVAMTRSRRRSAPFTIPEPSSGAATDAVNPQDASVPTSSRRKPEAGGGWGPAWGIAWVLLVVPAATAEFDYRYALPAVPLACLAAALALRPKNMIEPPDESGRPGYLVNNK